MAKRAPMGETTYDPLDVGLAQSVIHPRHAQEMASENVGLAEKGTPHVSPAPAKSVQRQISAAASHAAIMTVPMPQLRGFSRTKRVLLTSEEERNIERLVDRIAEHLGASLKLSHVLRACMALLCHAEAEVLRHANSHRLVRPANGDAVALAEFEQGIAKLLSVALRDAPPIR